MLNNTTTGKEKAFTILGFDERFNDQMGSAMNALVEESFGNATVIAVETKENHSRLQECYGVTMALNIVLGNPSAKVLLLAFQSLEMIRTRKPEIDVVLRHANVRFLRIPLSPQDAISAWDNLLDVKLDPNALLAFTQRQIGIILHRIKCKDPKNPANDSERRDIEKALEEARKVFPSLQNMPDNEAIDFLYEAAKNRIEVRKGEELDGVYCDVEGTVLVGENLRDTTLELLEKYASEGNSISLWTDGDVEILGDVLKSKGVAYPLYSKSDYAGAIVEIAIDDMDEQAFTARTKIHAKTFVRME